MLVESKLLLAHKKDTASSNNCPAVMLHLHLLQRVLGYHFYITPKQLFSIQKYWKTSSNKHTYSKLRERPIWASECNDGRLGVTKLYQCNICGLNDFILGSDIFMGFIDNKKIRLFFLKLMWTWFLSDKDNKRWGRSKQLFYKHEKCDRHIIFWLKHAWLKLVQLFVYFFCSENLLMKVYNKWW